MDERLRQRLNRKLLEANLSKNINTTNTNISNTNIPNTNIPNINKEISNELLNNEIYNDYLDLQEDIIPLEPNFSVIQSIVNDPSKLALVFLFGISIYALYVLSKSNTNNK